VRLSRRTFRLPVLAAPAALAALAALPALAALAAGQEVGAAEHGGRVSAEEGQQLELLEGQHELDTGRLDPALPVVDDQTAGWLRDGL
jgi:hypothetical protein